jgi:hypothetical protein
MNSNQNTNAGGAGQRDYLDKGLDAVEKKYGGSMGKNTEKNRGMNEKIVCLSSTQYIHTKTNKNTQTDGARNMFEKFTGKKVPSKFSN